MGNANDAETRDGDVKWTTFSDDWRIKARKLRAGSELDNGEIVRREISENKCWISGETVGIVGAVGGVGF